MTTIPGLRDSAASSNQIRAERVENNVRQRKLDNTKNKITRNINETVSSQAKVSQQQRALQQQSLSLQKRKNDLAAQARAVAQAQNRLRVQQKTASAATENVYSSVRLPSSKLNENPNETAKKVGLYIDASV